MKNTLLIICCILTLNSIAQKRTTQFSIAAEAGAMATKQAFSVYNLGFGGSGKVLFPTGKKKNFFTGTLGVLAFSGRSGPANEIFKEIIGSQVLPEPYNTASQHINVAHPSLTLIPVKIGYLFNLNSRLNSEVEVGYMKAVVKKLLDTYPGNIGGYVFSLGLVCKITKKLDIGLRYEQFESTASEKDYTSFVGLRTLLNIDFK